MAFFDWNQMIDDLPADWRATEGRNVRVALLDSGAELGHEALHHLDVDGHKYFFGFKDALLTQSAGNDPIDDQRPFGFPHGTACASVIAGQSPGAAGMRGVAPRAELFVIKVINPDGICKHDAWMAGLQQAVKLDVDIVCSTVLPKAVPATPQFIVDRVFAQLALQRILFFSTLFNTNDVAELLALKFPSNRPEAIVGGAVSDSLLAQLKQNPTPLTGIDFLMPARQVTFCTDASQNLYGSDVCRSSFATSCFAGAAALLLAKWKNDEGPGYRRRTRVEAMAELRAVLPTLQLSNGGAPAPLHFINLVPVA